MTNLHHPDFCSCRACLIDAARRLVGQLGPGEARAAARHTVIPADIMGEAIAGQAVAPAGSASQQNSEGNSVVGQIVARDHDDSPVPFTGRVLGQVDEETLEVAWGSEQDADYPRGTYEPADGLRPIRSNG